MAYSVPVGFAYGVVLAALGVFFRDRLTPRLSGVGLSIKDQEHQTLVPHPLGLELIGRFVRPALVGGVLFWLPALVQKATRSDTTQSLILMNLAMVGVWVILDSILSQKGNWGGRRASLFILIGIFFTGPPLMLLAARFLTGNVGAIPEAQFFATLLLAPLLTLIQIEMLPALWIVTLTAVSAFARDDAKMDYAQMAHE